MKKKRNMIEVVIRVMLFLILTAAHAFGIAVLFVFVWSELVISPFIVLNYIVKAAVSLVFSISVIVTWGWFVYLVLFPVDI